eukprot:UN02597
METDNGFPPVIMGDFNAHPNSDEIRYMRGFHALEGKTTSFYEALSFVKPFAHHPTWSPANRWISDTKTT